MKSVATVTSFDARSGLGTLEGGILINKRGLGVLDGGTFRRYMPTEMMRKALVGEDVYFQLSDRSAKLRAFWWAFKETPRARKLPEPGKLEIAEVLLFFRHKGFGFLTDPLGGEDLHVHLDKFCRYIGGKFVATSEYLHPPVAGEKVVIVRDLMGLVQSWARISVSDLLKSNG